MMDALPDGTLPPSQLNANQLAKYTGPGGGGVRLLFTLQGLPSASQHHLVDTYLQRRACLRGSSGSLGPTPPPWMP